MVGALKYLINIWQFDTEGNVVGTLEITQFSVED